MSSSSSNRHDTANWIYVKNYCGVGGVGGQKSPPFMFILEKLRMFFPNMNSHILAFSHVGGRKLKNQKIFTKYTLKHISEVLEYLQLSK